MPLPSFLPVSGRALLATLSTLLMATLSLPPLHAAISTTQGAVEGLPPDAAGVRAYLGIPYAAAPVGDLRWRAPQPPTAWTGTRAATAFGPRAMQGAIYSDMIFRDAGPSEDCLHLNVWTGAKSAEARQPVMVWIHGGGLQAGASSEPRQDGAILARKDVVVVSLNYRLGVFGFLTHPDLDAETGGSSGNYGLMDQIAALRWVHDNIAAFGGDPNNVTVFGESAGSQSVSALMVAPSARGLIHRAIGQSGAMIHPAASPTAVRNERASADPKTVKLLAIAGVKTIAELRQLPAADLLKFALSDRSLWFGAVIDGIVVPEDPNAIFAAHRQHDIPLLAGWTADEQRPYRTLGSNRPTAESFRVEVSRKYGPLADALLQLYPATTDAVAVRSAGDLANDTFIAFATWKWLRLQLATGHAPVYRFSFDRQVPVEAGRMINGVRVTAADVGAPHASDITYTFGAFAGAPEVPWEKEDHVLAELMMSYWSNFARTGNPNGPGLPEWPRYQRDTEFPVMHLDATSGARAETERARYEFLDGSGIVF